MCIAPSDELFTVCFELVLIAALPLCVETEGLTPPVTILVMDVHKARSEPFRNFSYVGWDLFCCEDCCFCIHRCILLNKKFIHELDVLADIYCGAAGLANKKCIRQIVYGLDCGKNCIAIRA